VKVTSGLVTEVTKMLSARTDASVIKAYIQNWTSPFSLTADDILHLHDIGASTDVLTALISHSSELQAQAAVVATPANPVPPDLVATNMPPAVLYPYPTDNPAPSAESYPSYAPVYSYPAYSYSSLYSYPYWSYPYYSLYAPWPYYRYGYYPRYYGYHYRYPAYPAYRYYGYGHYYGHPGGAWHGHH
jgi:hypothetical protein